MICGCQKQCGGVAKPVHRSTWFRHKEYRNEERQTPAFRAFVASSSRQPALPNNRNPPLGNNSGRAQPSRKRRQRDDTDEPNIQNADVQNADVQNADVQNADNFEYDFNNGADNEWGGNIEEEGNNEDGELVCFNNFH